MPADLRSLSLSLSLSLWLPLSLCMCATKQSFRERDLVGATWDVELPLLRVSVRLSQMALL